MRNTIVFIIAIVFLSSCMKELGDDSITIPSNDTIPNITSNKGSILIDASRDGGGWWFPQAPPVFDATKDHQGTKLAVYLHNLGYKVVELGRGTVITKQILEGNVLVVRAVGFGNYTADELPAYDEYLKGNHALFLINDYLRGSNDNLAESLGLKFRGEYEGTLTLNSSHPITQGTSSLPFIAGSLIFNPDKSKITVLGEFKDGQTSGVGMGILAHPTCKIFFIGDINGLENAPQPLTRNIFNWLLH
jgi:hypothetical protein